MDNNIVLNIKVDDYLQGSSSIPEVQDETVKPTSTPIGTPEQRFENAKPKKPKINLKTTGKALAAATAATVISNVGTLTGSQAAQNSINNATKVIGYGALIATNPILGLGALALTVANNAIKIAKETREWNLAETRNSERLGLTSSQKGR